MEIIKAMEVVNWKTTNAFLKTAEDLPGRMKLLFNAAIGLNPERISAGYMPEIKLIAIIPRTAPRNKFYGH